MNYQDICLKYGYANLYGANLRGADLRGADLYGANLRGADLYGANLRGANFYGANLRGANLRGANLRYADLREANLRYANLHGANLRGADLREANLRYADLRDANLRDAKLSPWLIVPQQGSFIGWKKTTGGVVKLLIPANSKRTSSLVGRKCRAEFVEVLEGSGTSSVFKKKVLYKPGLMVYADNYDDDIRVECSSGIHFFITKEEAEEF